MPLKLYVIVNKDILSPAQCAVQAAHSVAEFIFDYGQLPTVSEWVVEHKTLIILEANEKDFFKKLELIKKSNLAYNAFVEPDLNDQITAFTVQPLNETEAKIFKRMKLFKGGGL